MNPLAEPPAEPLWTSRTQDGVVSYTRPLIGSELLMFALHERDDGTADVCFGLTFTTDLKSNVLGERLKGALGYLRFISPLLACTIEKDAVDSAVNHWVYTPASDSQEVEQWAANSFKLIDDAVTPDEFVSQMVATRLPYVHPDGTKQYWKIYLLPNTPGGRMAIFTHGTHAIFDARPNLNMLRIILEEIVLQDRDHHVGQLPWGEEWKNLAPGPVTATGGPRPDWGTEGMKILRRWKALRTSDIPSHSLKPARLEIKDIGRQSCIHEAIDVETSSRIIKGLKQTGHTVTRLFEAALIIAMFEQNPELNAPPDEAHVTLDLSFISLSQYLVPPYNQLSHITSTSVIVPVKVPFTTVQSETDPRKKLCAVMDRLKAEYDEYLSNPHLPHLNAHIFALKPLTVAPSSTWRNPASLLVTNVGSLDRMIPLTYGVSASATSSRPEIEVQDLAFQHRWSHSARPLVHLWTIGGKLHIQVVAADVWDMQYLREYLGRAIALTSIIATDN